MLLNVLFGLWYSMLPLHFRADLIEREKLCNGDCTHINKANSVNKNVRTIYNLIKNSVNKNVRTINLIVSKLIFINVDTIGPNQSVNMVI